MGDAGTSIIDEIAEMVCDHELSLDHTTRSRVEGWLLVAGEPLFPMPSPWMVVQDPLPR